MEEDRRMRKGKRRVGKKVEPLPLTGLLNDSGSYDSPISVREILKNNKVDVTIMDLVAWSPAICKELKRLITRVSKKRAPKSTKQPDQAQQFRPSFPQQVPQPMPMPMPMPMAFQPMQSVPTAFMPAPFPAPAGQVPPPPPFQAGQVSLTQSCSVEAERHTRFLSAMIGIDKAWRVPCAVTKSDGEKVNVDTNHVQVDQGSDMNVLSYGLMKRLGIAPRPLDEIGFRGLSMKTADHRHTLLKHWTEFWTDVSSIVRQVKCFVAPEIISTTESGEVEHLSLILGIPWLYSVDAHLSIRNSTMLIEDASIGETIRAVQGLKMVFYKDHNLLMYPKSIIAPPPTVEEAESSSSESSSSGEDDLSDIEEIPRPNFSKQGF